MEFKVGDVVKCVNPSPCHRLIVGKTYTITGIDSGGRYISVDNCELGYYPSRFSLVEKLKEKFAEGDVVIVDHIFDKAVDSADGFQNSWVDSMDKFVGKTFTIKDITDTGIGLRHSDGSVYRFPPSCLKLVSDKFSVVIEKPKPSVTADLEFRIKTLEKENAYLLSLLNNS